MDIIKAIEIGDIITASIYLVVLLFLILLGIRYAIKSKKQKDHWMHHLQKVEKVKHYNDEYGNDLNNTL